MEYVLNLLIRLLLLWFPLHFESQAIQYLRDAEEIYGNAASSFRPREQVGTNITWSTSNIAYPRPAHIAQSLLPRSWHAASLSERITRLATNFSLQPVESSWITYVENCCKIWTTIASLVGTILLVTPALLAMPGTNGDPLVRGFVYLFLFSLATAFASAIILDHYFHKGNFRSKAFTMIWYKRVQESRQSCMDMPWTILASPVIATCWGFVFLALALFSSIWRTGLSPNPVAMEHVNPLVIRLVICTMLAADLAWIAWLVYTMKNLDQTSQVESAIQAV